MAATLPYASLPSPAQIAIECDPHHFRMVVPPNRSLRRLPRSYKLSLFLLLVHFLAVIVNLYGRGLQDFPEVAPAFVIDALGFTILFYLAYARTHCWSTFEITAHTFRFSTRIFSKDSVSANIPRNDLLEIRLNRHTGKMIIRAQRRDMREFFITPQLHDTQSIIDKLNHALTLPLQPIHLAAPVEARPTPAPQTQAQRRRSRTKLLLAALALILLTLVYPITGLILLIIAALAAIPLGIRFGTQEKDFYP